MTNEISDQPIAKSIWHITFKLAANRTNTACAIAVSLDDRRLDRLCVLLRHHHALLSLGKRNHIYVTLFWRSDSASTALTDAEEALRIACAGAGLEEYHVGDVRLINASSHNGPVDPEGPTASPAKLVSLNDVATAFGVSRQRASALYRDQRLPTPVAKIGPSPGWVSTQFVTVEGPQFKADMKSQADTNMESRIEINIGPD